MRLTAWSFRTFAALWSVVLGPLLPLQADNGDVAEVLPADTLAYVGWARLVDEDDAGATQLKAFLGQPPGARPADPKLRNLTLLMELLARAADKPGGLALLDLAVNEGQPDIQATLLVRAGAEAPALAEAFATLLQALLPDAQASERPVAGVQMTALTIPDAPLTILWGVHQGYFLITLGETATTKMIGRLNGEGAALADSDELKLARLKVGAKPGDATLSGYGDVKNIVAKAKALAEELAGPLPPIVEPLLEALGVNAIRSKYLHCSETEQGTWCRVFVHIEGERKGILKLWDQQPLAAEDLGLIPQDAYWAKVWKLDAARLWQDVLATIEAVNPDAVAPVQGTVAMSAGFLGFSITDDLLPAFGDTWALYDAPAHGGILLSGTVLVAQVKDRAAVQGMLLRTVELLKPMLQMNDVKLAVRQSSDGEHTIHYAVIGGVPCPVAPAWGFAGDRVVFGLFPQTVKVALNQVDPQTRRASIVERPDFKKATQDILPGRFQSFGFSDSLYFTRLLYPLGLAYSTAGNSMLSGTGVELDFNAFPPLAEKLQGTHNTFATCSVDDDGILYAQVGAASGTLVAVAVAALAVSILVPSLARARELAKRTVSAANLRGIGQALHIYANEHQDRFPEALEELIDTGVITRDMLSSPRDRAGAVSYVYIAGQSAADDARNMVVYERVIGDEGTNALFVDGHVEWMKLDDFKRALQATYERLGRTDELPAELRP